MDLEVSASEMGEIQSPKLDWDGGVRDWQNFIARQTTGSASLPRVVSSAIPHPTGLVDNHPRG